ncbi:MAG: DNA-binding protein [Candidatus Anstonellales archaeon]
MDEDDEQIQDLREQKKKKLQEAIEAYKEQQKLEQIKKAFLIKVLDSSAFERMMNVKISNKELYDKAVEVLMYLYQQRKINENRKLTEPELRSILSKMINTYEPKIEFRRKDD